MAKVPTPKKPEQSKPSDEKKPQPSPIVVPAK